MAKGQQTIKTVEDALELLAEVAAAGGMTVAEMSKALKLSRDKAFRLVKTLKDKKWLEDLGDGNYGLGQAAAMNWAAYRNRLNRKIDRCHQALIETEISAHG